MVTLRNFRKRTQENPDVVNFGGGGGGGGMGVFSCLALLVPVALSWLACIGRAEECSEALRLRSLQPQQDFQMCNLSAPKVQRSLRFAIAMPITYPRNLIASDFGRQDTARLHPDLRLRWKIASDLRFRAATSEPQTPSFSGIFWQFGSVKRGNR